MIRKRKTADSEGNAVEMNQAPIPGKPDDDIEIKYLEEDEIPESAMKPTAD